MSNYQNENLDWQKDSHENQYQQPIYQQQPPMYNPPQYQPAMGMDPPAGYVQKSRIAAGFLAIFMGALGMHSFYLGNVSNGLTRLLVSLLTFGFGAIVMVILGVRDGVKILDGRISTDAYGIYFKD